MYLRRDQTCAVEEILGDLGADSEGHLGVLHHLDQQLRHLVGRHDQSLGCAATHLRRSTAMEVAHERPVHRFATAPLARLQRAVAAQDRGRQLRPSGLAVAALPPSRDQLTAASFRTCLPAR